MMVIGKRGQEILSWEAWEQPVAKADHWVEGRSAMEVARAFFRHGEPRVPGPLMALLHSSPALLGFTADEAHPEFRTELPPDGSSGPRNHDVWLRGMVGDRKVCVGVEAKADEPFDVTLAGKDQYGDKRTAEGKATDMPDRLAVLGRMLFGATFNSREPTFSGLRYQLVSGAAGTRIQAARDGASTAVFVLYEFSSAKTSPKKQAENATDLDAFAGRLSTQFESVSAGQLLGPVQFDATLHLPRSVELFIGKAVEAV